MRIAHLGVKGLPSKSGTERVVEAIVTRMIGKFDITVYCDADYTPLDTHYKGVRLIRIPTIKGRYLKPISLDIFSALHALFLVIMTLSICMVLKTVLLFPCCD